MIGRILVVDDEKDFADVMTEYLLAKGYQAEMALSGTEGLQKIESFKPHLVLLDFHMPGMDGFELLDRIRKMDREIGIIMITALNDSTIGKRALKQGASDFITKPVNLEYLETSVLGKIVDVLNSVVD